MDRRPLPPGYLLTWHTYGTWLPGDEAWSVDRAHNEFGTPPLPASEDRWMDAAEKLRVPPVVLSAAARKIVEAVIREHCVVRTWSLAALAVRTNHVHVVVVDPLVKPEMIVQQLKQWTTRRLRGQGFCDATDPVWARHASTRFLYEKGTVEKAVDYVLNHQDEDKVGYGRRVR